MEGLYKLGIGIGVFVLYLVVTCGMASIITKNDDGIEDTLLASWLLGGAAFTALLVHIL